MFFVDKSKWMESNLDNGRIGCDSISSGGNRFFFTGNIMEIGLWNVALTSTQVTSLYGNGGSTAKKANTIPAGLRVYYPLSGTTVTNEAIDEKVAITNVPVGTRYEETDTRKIFRRKADISTTFDGTDENDWTDTFNDDVRGTKIQAGHTLIEKVITSIT